ncbi:MAG: DUF2256 domain-containing protein [Saprospiraceae bacterium]|nr:DUF2256 domain-containing protein [Saprospiraceae bacterium]MDW8228692.1 DUF2256 domain-containing protein [Saprospiraceae bacterium]
MKKPDKANLPQKVCLACGRPFSWRKKWERCWEEVRYCSDRCRRHKGAGKRQGVAHKPPP